MGIHPSALYEAVYSDVSEHLVPSYDTRCPSEITYKQFASSYLLKSVIRKWIPDDTRDADAAAYNAFVEANNLCRDWNLPSKYSSLYEMIIGEVRKDLDDFFHPGGSPLVSSLFDLMRFGRPGPGAVNGQRGTSLYEKYLSGSLTSTSEYLYSLYKDYIAWIPFFSEAECQRYEKNGSPRIVSGSRTTFVPKTSSISRMVCVEPSLNILFSLVSPRSLSFVLSNSLELI